MAHENGDNKGQRGDRTHLQGMLDETDPLNVIELTI